MTITIVLYVSGLFLSWIIARLVPSSKSRQALLLILSCALYASWGLWFLAVLLGSTLMNYRLGNYLRARPTAGRLWIGVGLNVFLLGFFKYLPPLAGMLWADSGFASLSSHIIQPIGLSFWTFQALSYLFDLYREEDLHPSLWEFCLYMAFWPTVLSGPICRMGEMLPQFRQDPSQSKLDVRRGLERISVGVMMVGLARLLGAGLKAGEGINAMFDQTSRHWSGGDVGVLTIGYGFLLFFDFAGYSHLAIGAARFFGFRVPENFDRPYLSGSPSVFWTRWHMSLSFWIRDYLFLPLAAARREMAWRNFALVASMVIFGLWHKGNLLFLLWGTYHGILLVLHRFWQNLQRRWAISWSSPIAIPVSWGVTFGAINLGWVFFRANDSKQAFSMLGAALWPGNYRGWALPRDLYTLILASVLGYFLVVLAGWLLNPARLDAQLAEISRPPRRVWHTASAALGFLARDKWIWVGPLLATVVAYVFSVILLQETAASRFLYMLF